MPRSKPCLGLNPKCADRWPEFISHGREVGGGGKRGLNISGQAGYRPIPCSYCCSCLGAISC